MHFFIRFHLLLGTATSNSAYTASMTTSLPTQSQMDANMVPIASLTQESKRWSAKVLLVKKSHRRKTRQPGKEFQRYIFVDEAGTQIQGMSYTPDTTIVDTVLQPMGTYIISNAKIVPCNMQFRIVDHPLQWVLTTSTSMEPTLDSPLSWSLAVPPFTPFSQFQQHKSSDTNLNVLAIVVDTSNLRTINGIYGTSNVQDLVLITDEKIPILLSCWNDFITSEAAPIIQAAPNFPIIAGLRLRAQEFRGLSLAAKGLANLLLNPPYPDAEPLKAWDFLVNIVHDKQYFTYPTSNKFTNHTEVTSIVAMLNSPNDGHFTVKAQLSLLDEQQDYYYMSCPSCFHNTTANPGMHFTCRNCDKQNLPKPMARCTITISDNLTQMGIVAFGEIAARLLGISADELLNMDTKETPIDLSTINNTLANKTFELHIRKKPSTSQNAPPFYYNLNDYKLVLNEGPNTPEHRPTKRTSTLATTPQPSPSATHQNFTKQAPTNKNPRLSSSALFQRASTKIAYQGTTIESPTTNKEHSA